MSAPSDGWDRDEEDMPQDLAQELAALRSRRAGDPPIEVLRAAGTGVLPEPLESAANRHLAASAWSRALVEGVNDADVTLSPHDEARILADIRRQAKQVDRTRTVWTWRSQAAAAAAVIAVVGAWWILPRTTPQQATVSAPPAQVATAPSTTAPPPTFLLPLERPEVRVSLASLTWRGTGSESPLLADLKLALDAFRAGDYQTADREFSVQSPRYPAAIEIALYQGVARLFLNNLDGALESLNAAERLADSSFSNDVTWYLAVAEERAGKADQARLRLETICPGTGRRDPRACAVLGR